MDTRPLPKATKILPTAQQQPSHPHPQQQPHPKTNAKQAPGRKRGFTEAGKAKAQVVQVVQEGERRPSLSENDHEACLVYLAGSAEGDSDFEFSAEMMGQNPRQESRECREKGKMCHLAIFDWMMKVAAMLKLSKECFYRGIVIMKKFMFLDQKQPAFRVNLANVNLYGLAALLISSKFENIDGNFLANISHIADQNCAHINKHTILDCEMYIMTTIRFQVANCSIIVESILAVLQAWADATRHSILEGYALSRLEEMGAEEGDEGEEGEESGQDERRMLLQKFIYLVDFVVMRKLVELRVKDIRSVDNPSYFRRVISNVLLHLITYLIQRSPEEKEQMRAYRKVFREFAAKVEISRQQFPALQRKSHLLSKLIRSLFTRAPKNRQFASISHAHSQLASLYCLCRLDTLSTKYIAPLPDKEANTNDFHAQDDHDTDPFASEPTHQKHILGSSERSKPEERRSGCRSKSEYCRRCVNSTGMLRGIVNNQFYVELLLGRRE